MVDEMEDRRLRSLYQEKGAALTDDIINAAEKTLTKKIGCYHKPLEENAIKGSESSDDTYGQQKYKKDGYALINDTKHVIKKLEQTVVRKWREHTSDGKIPKQSFRVSSDGETARPKNGKHTDLPESPIERKGASCMFVNSNIEDIKQVKVHDGKSRLLQQMEYRTIPEYDLNDIEKDLIKLNTKSQVESQYERPKVKPAEIVDLGKSTGVIHKASDSTRKALTKRTSKLSVQFVDDVDKKTLLTSNRVMTRQGSRFNITKNASEDPKALFQKSADTVISRSRRSTTSKKDNDRDEDESQERMRVAEKADHILRTDDYDEGVTPLWGKAWKRAMAQIELVMRPGGQGGDVTVKEKKIKEILDSISNEIDIGGGLVISVIYFVSQFWFNRLHASLSPV